MKLNEAKLPAPHMLLIGASKSGKTHYAARLAADGKQVVFFDADNGLRTLKKVLAGDAEAQDRVTYIRPKNIAESLLDFITSKRWEYNESQRATWLNATAKPDDEKLVLEPAAMGAETVVVIDSLTALAENALAMADKKSLALESDAVDMRQVYRAAGARVDVINRALQKAPFGVLMIAHPTIYEEKIRPAGLVGEIKEKHLTVRDTYSVPLSTSAPNGFKIGKYYGEVGWLSVKRTGARELDFTPNPLRVGGGTITTKGDPNTTHSWVTLFEKDS